MTKFLKKVIGFSLKNKYFILFATAILVAAGVICFKQMSIDAYPDITNTEITIITQWPGRSAEEIEKFVTIPIEIAMNPVQNKTSLRSTSISGLSVVDMIFKDGVTYNQARLQINSLLPDANLPDGVTAQVQPDTGPTGEIFRYTLESKIRGPRELKTIQDWICDRAIRAVPGVGDIVSFGGMVKTYEIQVNPQKLTDLGLTPLDVYSAVARSNINVGGNIIERNNQAYVVRGIGLLNNINDIKNIIIQNNNGVPVFVKDVANVVISNLPRLGQVGRTDIIDSAGHYIIKDQPDVVEAIVLMRKGENPKVVINALRETITKLNTKILPADTKIVSYYNRENLINFATNTVMHNMVEGILLVTLIVLLFMFNWRTTLIVALIVPLSLLFAFMCLYMMGMSPNMLSLGAVDFGIIIDGTVVMVEGLFVLFDHKAKEIGMQQFNKIAKLGMVRKGGATLGKAIFIAKIIIIIALIPIFAFEGVAGKLFSPLAYTLGLALIGALIYTLTLVPVLFSMLIRKNVRERYNPVVHYIMKGMMQAFEFVFRHRKTVLIISGIVIIVGLYSFKLLGTEFLPEMDEGALWVRIQLPYSISLEKSVEIATQARKIMAGFPEVRTVVSQTGRPDDGTDVTGFYNNEFDVILYPESDWIDTCSKEKLISEMSRKLSVIPGADLNFSQPISDNVEEAVSGVKGDICLKIWGDSLDYMENKVDRAYNVLKTVRGIADLGVIKNIGQPEMDINLNRNKMALYGVSAADANAVIQMAIGGVAATQLYEGIEIFDVRIRFPEEFRQNITDVGNLMVPTMSGAKVPIKEIATITERDGPCLIFRDGNQRYSALKFSIRGRDMGSTMKEAIKKVYSQVHLKKGYSMKFQGDFQNEQSASKRLAQVIPVSLLLIFIVLLAMFGNFKDAGLVFLDVPFALVGGVAALFITGTEFSISAGIGFICLFGICILQGVLLISAFKQNLEKSYRSPNALFNSIKQGVFTYTRPVLMTALMDIVGLLPAAISTGIGSESARPLARVVIGGMMAATVFSLVVFPLVFAWAYRKVDQKHQMGTDGNEHLALS